jgi:hypothetical protein
LTEIQQSYSDLKYKGTGSNLRDLRKVLLGENSNSLAALFGSANETLGAPPPLVDPERAVWVLGADALAFVLPAASFFQRRDVT